MFIIVSLVKVFRGGMEFSFRACQICDSVTYLFATTSTSTNAELCVALEICHWLWFHHGFL